MRPKPTSPERLIVLISVAVFATALAYAIYYPYSPIAQQQRNMQLAQTFIPKARAAISSDPRFSQITLEPYTDQGGSLGVGGPVRIRDFPDLQRLLTAISPPVKISWCVQRLNDDQFLEATSQPTTDSIAPPSK